MFHDREAGKFRKRRRQLAGGMSSFRQQVEHASPGSIRQRFPDAIRAPMAHM
jgi:hypothetical protein